LLIARSIDDYFGVELLLLWRPFFELASFFPDPASYSEIIFLRMSFSSFITFYAPS
jgi:hypothetical protein